MVSETCFPLNLVVRDGKCTGLLSNAFQLLTGTYAYCVCAPSCLSIGHLMGSCGSAAYGPQISKSGDSSAVQASVAF